MIKKWCHGKPIRPDSLLWPPTCDCGGCVCIWPLPLPVEQLERLEPSSDAGSQRSDLFPGIADVSAQWSRSGLMASQFEHFFCVPTELQVQYM